MALLDIQRRGQQIGRIRIGQQVPSSKSGKMRPAKLDTFRITTGSRYAAEAIAELYGGEVKPWNSEFEVITSRSAIDVTVPPRDQVVSQWYEMWSGGGCQRRCDSQVEQLTGKPCMCPSDPLERDRLSKLIKPQACKPITRVNVMIPDLPGLGVFRIDTGSYYAAVEIGDAAELMQAARDRGIYLPATLRIDQRQRIANGEMKRFPVPVLEVMVTFRQIVTGELGVAGIAAQLPPAPGEQRRALTSGQTGAPAATREPAVAQTHVKQLTPEAIAASIVWQASRALSRGEIERLVQQAKDERVYEDHVCTDEESDTWEELAEYLRAVWRALPVGGDA